jgi:hypothetical protein
MYNIVCKQYRKQATENEKREEKNGRKPFFFIPLSLSTAEKSYIRHTHAFFLCLIVCFVWFMVVSLSLAFLRHCCV